MQINTGMRNKKQVEKRCGGFGGFQYLIERTSKEELV